MECYIFNKKYFKDNYIKGSKCGVEYEKIANKIYCSVESVRSKINGRRKITKDDYNSLNKADELLILDINKLVCKLISRVNLDLYPNTKIIIYILIEKDNKSMTLDEIVEKVKENCNTKINSKKIENILNNGKIKIDKLGKKDSIFCMDNGKYGLNLNNIIKYTNL